MSSSPARRSSPPPREVRIAGACAALAAVVFALPSAGLAQGAGQAPAGMKPPAVPLPSRGMDFTVEDDFTLGPPILAVPPLRADGRPDATAYKVIHAALREKFGDRLIAEDKTLAAIAQEKIKAPTLASAEGVARLAEAVKATRVIVFRLAGGSMAVQVLKKPDGAPAAVMSFGWPRRPDRARADKMVDEILRAGRDALRSPPALVELPPVTQESVNDIREEAREVERPPVDEGPMRPPRAFFLAGAGVSLRDLRVASARPSAPQSRGAMPALGAALALLPLRWFDATAGFLDGALADLSLEGLYRRTFADAQVAGGGGEAVTCTVDDDEIVGRLSWRYPIGGWWPSVGAAAGLTWEQAAMRCPAKALSTRYRTIELHLKVLQPIIGERLGLDLSGGPRIVYSAHAAGFPADSYSAEGWVFGRPIAYLYLRAGARWTRTHLKVVPEAVPVTDTRTFVGVEVGGAL